MKRILVALIIMIVVGITGYLTYKRMSNLDRAEKNEILEQEVQQKKIETLEEQVSTLQEELEEQEDKLVPKEKLAEVFGEEATTVTPEVKEPSCEDIKGNMTAFFNHLDKQAYVKSYEIKESSLEFFKRILAQLSETTPRVTGEMVGLPTLMSNMAYFYRRLGKKRVDFIREILMNESDISESVFKTLYQWTTSCDRCGEMAQECPSLKTLYEYAGFFLNTLAGRSYLLRRNSRERILTSYYSIVILDKANEETLNRHGIDIIPHIDFISSEIINQRGLVHKKQYLATLNSLKQKYQVP
jgi:hypothetical protein